jgi:hypothetical protein
MKLRYLVDSDNFSAQSRLLRDRMEIFFEYYFISPDNVSLIINQGAVEKIVNISPENKYCKIKEIHPMKKERGELCSLNAGKSAIIKIGEIEYQIRFKSKNPSQ